MSTAPEAPPQIAHCPDCPARAFRLCGCTLDARLQHLPQHVSRTSVLNSDELDAELTRQVSLTSLPIPELDPSHRGCWDKGGGGVDRRQAGGGGPGRNTPHLKQWCTIILVAGVTQSLGPPPPKASGLSLRGKTERKGFVTPTETTVRGDALCLMVMGPSLLQRLAVGGWRLAVGGWRLAVGEWRRLVAVGGWPLAVGGGWWRLAVPGGCP